MVHHPKDEILFQFFAGYFNQDWVDDCATWQCVLDQVLKDWNREEIEELLLRLQDDFVNTELSEDELVSKADDLGFNYRVEGDGYTMRSWLKEAMEYLSRE